MRKDSNILRKGNIVSLYVEGRWFQYDDRQIPIGEGAMGIVYMGYELTSNRKVAIKKIKDQYLNNQDIRMRAQQEAQLSFSHPNLVEIIGVAQNDPHHGPLFIISRFIQGVTMDTFVKNNLSSICNPQRKICELFLPVLDALSFIHSHGIIHMDIKPSNIMVEDGRNVRLMDLGIAHVVSTNFGSTSGLMGTPNYAAPEQFELLESQPSFSPSTDIYEAGVTLYEFLTSENPFRKNTLEEIKESHKKDILPSSPKLTPSLLKVLRKATDIEAAKRYQNAKEFSNALKLALQYPNGKTIFERFSVWKERFFHKK